MRYLLAIFLPPVAVLVCGKPFQFIISIILTLCFWLPGAIHALLIVSSTKADERNREVVNAIRSSQGAGSPMPMLPQESATNGRNATPGMSGKMIAGLIVGGFAFLTLVSVIGTALLPETSIENEDEKENAIESASEREEAIEKPEPVRETIPRVADEGESQNPIPQEAPEIAVEPEPIEESTENVEAPETIFDEREWKSADGEKSFVGVLEKIGVNEVTMRTEGKTFTFPVSRLSEADREYIGQGIIIETADGRTYGSGTISRIDSDSILFVTQSGPVSISESNLPEELATRLGFSGQSEAEPVQEAETVNDSPTFDGYWILTDAMSGGISGTHRASSHQSWTIDGDRITLNGDRSLWLRLREDRSPKELYIENELNGRTITVYSCIYQREGNRLTVCFAAGETPPDAFTAGEYDFNFLLYFVKQ